MMDSNSCPSLTNENDPGMDKLTMLYLSQRRDLLKQCMVSAGLFEDNVMEKTKMTKEDSALYVQVATRAMAAEQRLVEDAHHRQMNSTTPKNRRRCRNPLMFILKLFTHTSLGLLWMALLASYSTIYIFKTYVTVLHEQMEFTEDRLEDSLEERTYFNRMCTNRDLTATTLSEITLDNDNNHNKQSQSRTLIDTVMTHGAGVLPSLLAANTTRALRDTILTMNQHQSQEDKFNLENDMQNPRVNIQSPEHRYVVRPGPHDYHQDETHAISAAFEEIGQNAVLKRTLEGLLGPNPSLVEMSSITSEPGAAPQNWHSDTMASHSHQSYARAFVPMYSLFVILQDTDSVMGATGLCLGTHMCFDYDPINHPEEEDEDYSKCPQVSTPAGAGLIYNSQNTHRGSANTAYHYPDPIRAVLILTFASRPRIGYDPRQLPLGSTYSSRWDMWNQNLDDFATVKSKTWHPLTSLGLYKPKQVKAGTAGTRGRPEETHWGWNFWMVDIASELEERHVPYLQLENMVTKAVKMSQWNMMAVLAFLCFLMLLDVFLQRRRSAQKGAASLMNVGDTNAGYRTIRVQFTFYVISTLVVGAIFYLFSLTEWAQMVQSHNRFGRVSFVPPPTNMDRYSKQLEVEMSERYVLETPRSHDVLFSDRFNAHYLFEQSYYLDYNPGNRHWRNLIREAASDYAHLNQYGIDDRNERDVSGVGMLKRAYLQHQIVNYMQNSQISFFQQSPYADWMELNKAEVIELTRRAVLDIISTSPISGESVTKILNKEMDYMESQCKYGDGGQDASYSPLKVESAMCRRFVPQRLRHLKGSMYLESGFVVERGDVHGSTVSMVNVPITSSSSIRIGGGSRKRMSLFEPFKTSPLHKHANHNKHPLGEIVTDASLNLRARFHSKRTNVHTIPSPDEWLALQSKRYGVQQEGIEHEEIAEVVEEMVDWMKENELANRKRCWNKHKTCGVWAAMGNCDDNPGHMEHNCAPMCHLCDW